MPPGIYSRNQFCVGFTDATTGKFMLNEREPFLYQPFADTRQHIVQAGDNLWSLASFYFAGFPDPPQMYWIIADFQPIQIIDASIALKIGQVLAIPSNDVVKNLIFNQTRQQFIP